MHPTPKSADATTVAVDLAKEVFELAFADNDARIVDRRRLPRAAFAAAFENRAPLRIVMEACGSAHNRARRFVRLGHAVRLLPAHDVRPYVRRNKTDRTDAAGLLEAVTTRPPSRSPTSRPGDSGQPSIIDRASIPITSACASRRTIEFPPRVAPSETSMANESVPGTIKPITLLACVAD